MKIEWKTNENQSKSECRANGEQMESKWRVNVKKLQRECRGNGKRTDNLTLLISEFIERFLRRLYFSLWISFHTIPE